MDATVSTTFSDLFPYLISAVGGLTTILIGLVLRNQTSNQQTQQKTTEAIVSQSQQLTRLTVLIEGVIEDKIPAIEKRIDRIEDKI